MSLYRDRGHWPVPTLAGVLLVVLATAPGPRTSVAGEPGLGLGLQDVVPPMSPPTTAEPQTPIDLWTPPAGWDGFTAPETPDAREFALRVGEDLVALLKAPVAWDGSSWRTLGLGVAAVAGVSLVDEDINRWLDDHQNGSTIKFAESLRPLGQELGLALLGTTWLAGRGFNRPELTAVAQDGLEAAVLSAGVITPALKLVTGRTRPRNTADSSAFGSSGASFPSGETTMAFAIAAVVAEHSDRWWIDAAAWGTAGLVGVGRMRLDAHWASDVVAGALIGASVGRWVVRRHHPEPTGPAFTIMPTVAPGRYEVTMKLRL